MTRRVVRPTGHAPPVAALFLVLAACQAAPTATAAASCGNGVLEPGEACDGTALGGLSCAALPGLSAGGLVCAADCSAFDVSSCSKAPGITATTCSDSAVQAAVDGAPEGATVYVPAGSCEWTNGVLISGKPVTLMGAGQGNTIITNRRANPYDASVTVNVAADQAIRISGMTFLGNGGSRSIAVLGTSRTWRIDNCRFSDNGHYNAIYIRGITHGLIDHCRFENASQEDIAVLEGDGKDSWSRPLALGTAGAVFIEACSFAQSGTVTGGHAVTSDSGGRYVFRHNVVAYSNAETFNTPVDVHGNCSTGCGRGGRSYEIYANTITGPGVGWAVVLRGGDGVVYDNTLESRGPALYLREYRANTALCASASNYCDPTDYPQCSASYPSIDQIRNAYFWNNVTPTGAPLSPSVEESPRVSEFIVLERDFHAHAPSDYAAYPYPHPFGRLGVTTPELSVSDVVITEGDAGQSSATVTIRLSAPSERPVSVDFAAPAQRDSP